MFEGLTLRVERTEQEPHHNTHFARVVRKLHLDVGALSAGHGLVLAVI
jgi:hypothetical protein